VKELSCQEEWMLSKGNKKKAKGHTTSVLGKGPEQRQSKDRSITKRIDPI